MNQAEIASWNGLLGERWALFQEALDARFRVFGTHALLRAALREGQRVLDVGCGCADLVLDAAEAVGSAGRVVGLDVSRPMLARAKERVGARPNIALVEHDAATFVADADAPFDVVLSRFGVMFFEDPRAAFSNLHRTLVADGTLAFVCWQPLTENPWAAIPLRAMASEIPPAAPASKDAPGPFAFADPEKVRAILESAGFREVLITPATHPITLGGSLEEALEFACRMGPSSRALRELDDPGQARAVALLREALASLAPGFTLDGAVWIVSARA
jgi:ubiquinone/menaquinone biosynthesis C-methylase UbiE